MSYIDAILGTTIKVTTVDGPVELKIPAGTQPGTTLLMKGRGAPSPLSRSKERGNHLVKVRIEIPRKPSAEERKLCEKLRDLQMAGADKEGKVHLGPFKF